MTNTIKSYNFRGLEQIASLTVITKPNRADLISSTLKDDNRNTQINLQTSSAELSPEYCCILLFPNSLNDY